MERIREVKIVIESFVSFKDNFRFTRLKMLFYCYI